MYEAFYICIGIFFLVQFFFYEIKRHFLKKNNIEIRKNNIKNKYRKKYKIYEKLNSILNVVSLIFLSLIVIMIYLNPGRHEYFFSTIIAPYVLYAKTAIYVGGGEEKIL